MPNGTTQVDPLEELRRARAERDAARGVAGPPAPGPDQVPDDDPIAALQAARAERDAAREAPSPGPETVPAEAPDEEKNLFQRVRDFVFPQFRGDPGRIGLPPTDEAPATEEEPGRPLTRMERQAAGLPPIVEREGVTVGEIGEPDPDPREELVFDPFRREFVEGPGERPPALPAIDAFTDELGLQPVRIPDVQPPMSIIDRVTGVGKAMLSELHPDIVRERDPREQLAQALQMQADVNVGISEGAPPEAEPVSGRMARPFGAAPPSMRRSTRLERLNAAVNRGRRELQEEFEELPLGVRMGISASRAILDANSLGRFDSHVSDLIHQANQVVASVRGVDPPQLTVSEVMNALDRSLPEKLVGGAAFLTSLGAGIRVAGMGVASTAQMASRGSRTRAFLQSFNPNVPVARSTRMLQAAVEGVPFDLAFEAEDPQERAANLVIGLVASSLLGATPVAGRIERPGELDPRIRDPRTAIGATRTGPEAFPIRRERPTPPEQQTITEALEAEGVRIEAEERAAAEASAELADQPGPGFIGPEVQRDPETGLRRRPRVLSPENQAMHDAAEAAPDLPTLQRIMDNDPDWIAARQRPQPGDPGDTTNLHSDGDTRAVDGPVWDQRRVETVHDPTVTRLEAEENAGFFDPAERRRVGAWFEGPVRRERIIYMVTGPSAAGKSTLSNVLVRQIRGFLVDSDEVKKGIPEHDGGRAAGMVHRESSILSHNRMLRAAVVRGDNIVMPMIGKSREHVIDEAANLREAGYQVHIVLNELPPFEAARRAYLRFKRTDKYIPEQYILEDVGDAPTAMYREAVESGLFTSHQRYSNDVPKGQPARLLESGGDIPEGFSLVAEPTARTAGQHGPGSGPGGLGRVRDAGDAQRHPRGPERPRETPHGVAPSRAAQGDLFNPEVEIRHAPPTEGPARAPEVVPRRITDPMPPEPPLGTQANGRGGFFNLGALTRGRLGARAGAVRVPVREGVERARAFLRRHFTAPGDLPEVAWRFALKAEGWFGAQMGDMKFTIRRFDDALRDAYGTVNLNTSQARRLNAAMSGQIPLSRIPEEMRPIVKQMRERVDGYSRQMIQSGMVEGELAAVIADNLGTYLSRSYKVFDTPNWQLDNVPERIVNRARSWIRDERPELSEDEIQGLMRKIVDTKAESPLQFLTSGTLGSKDLSMLIKRKDIAPPIRALMGEHTDVRLRYARSVNNMARALANHGFLTSVKNSLLAGPDNPNGLFFKVETENARGAFVHPVAAKGSKVMEPLSGLFTTREIADAFQRQYNVPGAQHWLWNAYLKLNAIVKFDKTVLSMMTHVRNVIGNAGFATANGHWDVRHFGRAIQAVNASVGVTRAARLGTRAVADKLGVEMAARGEPMSPARAAQLERRLRIRDQKLEGETPWESYYRKLQLLGVVDSSAHAGELQAIIRDAANQGLDNVSPDPNLISRAARTAAAVYRAEDDLWKVVAFENEFARYRKAMPDVPEAQVEETAAWIVRNTYPNYGMISSGVQQLRRNILVGNFVSFPAEVFRTGWHTINLALRELSSPNPEIRRIGATRMVGTTIAASGLYAATAASRWINGVDRRTDEDLRPFLPTWQENSSLIYTDRPDDGVYSLIDLSYTDPYSYLRDPLRALLSGDGDWEEKLLDASIQAMSPFLGQEILFEKLSEINLNQRRRGGQVFNPEDHKVDQAYSILNHLWTAIEPGTLTSMRRINRGLNKETNVFGQEFDAMTEFLAVVTGHRLQKTDVRQSLRFRTTELNRRKSDANRILNRVANREGRVTDEELTEAFHRSEASRARVFADGHELALKAINSHGLTTREVTQQFRDAGYSRVEAAAIVNTGVPPRRNVRIDDVDRAALIRRLQGR